MSLKTDAPFLSSFAQIANLHRYAVRHDFKAEPLIERLPLDAMHPEGASVLNVISTNHSVGMVIAKGRNPKRFRPLEERRKSAIYSP